MDASAVNPFPSGMAPSPDPQPGLARAIAQLRKGRGLTQEQLAELAHQHPTRISHLESGRVNPRWGVVRQIAAALGVTMKELAALAEELEADDPVG